MEPLKPTQKQEAIAAAPAPNAAQLMAEYEQLLAERFAHDPDAAPSKVSMSAMKAPIADREKRIRQLHDLLFPSTRKSGGA